MRTMRWAKKKGQEQRSPGAIEDASLYLDESSTSPSDPRAAEGDPDSSYAYNLGTQNSRLLYDPDLENNGAIKSEPFNEQDSLPPISNVAVFPELMADEEDAFQEAGLQLGTFPSASASSTETYSAEGDASGNGLKEEQLE